MNEGEDWWTLGLMGSSESGSLKWNVLVVGLLPLGRRWAVFGLDGLDLRSQEQDLHNLRVALGTLFLGSRRRSQCLIRLWPAVITSFKNHYRSLYVKVERCSRSFLSSFHIRWSNV